MQTQARFGSEINLSVLRASGKLEHFGPFYNHPRSGFFSLTNADIRCNRTANLNFMASSTPAVVAIAGTWQQSGTTVSRASGSATLPTTPNLYKFADGSEAGVRVAGSGSSITVSRSGTVSAQTLYQFNDVSPVSEQELSSIPSSRSYLAGVIETSSSAPAFFTPASASYTLRCIYQSQTSINNAEGVYVQIEPGIAIGIGDQIIINSYLYRFDYGGHTPRAFAVSPILGLSGSGFFQRTRRITVRDNSTSPNRIFLLTAANAITLPNMFGPVSGTLLNPASYTIAETIIATGVSPTPNAGNDYTESHSCFGNTAIGGTIKQIAWGTTTEIFGIIEYDTPVTIATGKVLTVGMSTRLAPVLTLP